MGMWIQSKAEAAKEERRLITTILHTYWIGLDVCMWEVCAAEQNACLTSRDLTPLNDDRVVDYMTSDLASLPCQCPIQRTNQRATFNSNFRLERLKLV